MGCGTELAELVAEFGLGIQPGAGDAGVGGDLGDGALLAGVTEVLEGLAGALKVSSRRRWAAAMRWWLLSGRIG